MKKLTFSLLTILCIFSCKKESTTPLLQVGSFQFSETTTLPTIINESSGLEMATNGNFWSFNDRNGAPDLYQFDTTGMLTRVLNISNATNVDWEDMTKDAAGNIYVGDFGNNDNDRQDLVIYKIASTDVSGNSNSVTATKIEFSYPEQTAFPPADNEAFFDVESMFSKGEFLYLLTRDRSDPFIGKTSLYRLPNTPGTYEATFVVDFFTNTNKDKGQITAADLSPDGKTLAMISKEKMWLFQNISGDDFFAGEVLNLDLPIQLDMEGAIFADDCTLYLSNEDKPSKPAILYKIAICP